MIRKKKSYLKPKKTFEKGRIQEENVLLKRYGLKNKREIWKALAKVDYLRGRAKALAKSSPEEQQVLLNKLKSLGLQTNTIADVLDLKIEDVLKRRLATIVFSKGLANTPQQARQMVVHKRILIDGKVTSSPSYFVSFIQEPSITLKTRKKTWTKTEGISQTKEEKQEQLRETDKSLEESE